MSWQTSSNCLLVRKWKELTALSIHLNEKRCHSDLSGWNGQIEEEDRDPCEKEIITQLASFLDDLHMISKSMQNRNDTKGLCDSSEKLLLLISMAVLLQYQCSTGIKLIPKRQGTESMPSCRIY